VEWSQACRSSVEDAGAGDESEGALGEVLARPRYEVFPAKGAEDLVARLPKEAKVTVTCSPTRGIESTLLLTERLAERGLQVVPHISARLVADEEHLEGIVRRLGDLGVREIFVIGGDAKKPVGSFSGAFGLLCAMADMGHDFEHVGIAGYPEGHPVIGDDALRRALRDKLPFATYIVSQICFDPRAIVDWVADIRRGGIRLPVIVGIPGVVDNKRLFQVSRRIGVGDSARFLKKHTNLTMSLFAGLFKSGGYSPDDLVGELAPYVGDLDFNIIGFHVYTFNQIESTEKWRRRMLHPGDGHARDRRRSGGDS
jgi:methylenetetrahydrofolate reductase (NADPH)